MVAAVNGGNPPPPLRLAWMCSDSHLPETGGVMDQDYVTMRQMRYAENVFNAVYLFTHARGAEIHNMTDSQRLIVKDLLDEGYLNG